MLWHIHENSHENQSITRSTSIVEHESQADGDVEFTSVVSQKIPQSMIYPAW